jgi:hypothetical protein
MSGNGKGPTFQPTLPEIVRWNGDLLCEMKFAYSSERRNVVASPLPKNVRCAIGEAVHGNTGIGGARRGGVHHG